MESDEDEVYMESDSNDDDNGIEFLNPEDLEADMISSIANVNTVLQVSNGMCRLLLQKYKWSRESLLDRFYENPSFLIDAHLLPEHPMAPSESPECQICCMEGGELSSLACNHMACNECWKSYLNEKIKGKQSDIECMATDCKLLMEDEKVLEYIDDPSLFKQVLIDSYVNTNKTLRWCPGTCQTAVKLTSPSTSLIHCPCGICFCFSCGNEGHEPISCFYLKKWLKRCEEESKTLNWISINTKNCPSCSTPIEKNGGCNYMRCHSCRHEFCWLCSGFWKDEGAHSCNKFQEQDLKEKRDKVRISIDRYLFYYNRSRAHKMSRKLEQDLKAVVEDKMNDMQELEMSWVEVQFLPKAFEILSESRRTLMYTYAFAYYLKQDNNKLIFETNQKDLEVATEQLSALLERELDHNDLSGMKQSVLDKSFYVQQRKRKLLDHCAEGNDLDFWVFNE